MQKVNFPVYFQSEIVFFFQNSWTFFFLPGARPQGDPGFPLGPRLGRERQVGEVGIAGTQGKGSFFVEIVYVYMFKYGWERLTG